MVCLVCDGFCVFVGWLHLNAGAAKSDVSGAGQSVRGTMPSATADGGRRLAEYGVCLCAALLRSVSVMVDGVFVSCEYSEGFGMFGFVVLCGVRLLHLLDGVW